MRSRFFRIIPVSALLAASVAGYTQDLASDEDEIEQERPRIGLVLGGGGARGAAHIGVLQELERQRIPIDAIAGTSMGAIVGSLYASGRTPAELEVLVQSIDWADAFSDKPNRRDLTFRRKQDDAAYPAPLELGFSDGEMLLPKGLIQGRKLQQILREQLLPVSHVDDFDDLPIPFRAVASNIETGETHVMSSGDLALAARASMSAPGIFAPVVVDGHTLVDGGLVGNVPVSTIRSMDVDIVIAVDVEFPLYKPEELDSALAITEQMLTMLIRKETLRELDGLGERDVLIRPELGDYGSTNFDDIDEVIEPGRLAAVAVAAHLAHLSMDEVTYGEHQASRKAFESSEATIDFVRVVSDGPLAASVLESKLKSAPGDVLDTASLAADLDRLYGLEYYEHVGYRLVTEDDRTGVEFQTRAKSWGPNFLKFGLSLEDNFEGSTEFNVSARLTATGLNSRGAEWRNDVQVGTSPRIESEFYQPLGLGSQFFLAPRIKLEQRNLNTFAGMDSIARYRVSEAEGGLDLGWTLGHWGEMRAGLLRGRGTAEVKVGDPSLPNDDFDDGGVLVRLAIDTLDDAQIAKHGTDAIVEWHGSHQSFGADSRKDTLFAAIDHAWSWGLGDRNTLRAGVEYATTYRSENLVQDFFTLGGFLRLSGLGRGEISGPHTGMARLVYMRRLGESGGGFFDMPLYIGGSLETGNAWQSRSEISFGSMLVNGSMFAGLDTTFGRLFVGAGFSEGGESSLYLFFGNPRPLER